MMQAASDLPLFPDMEIAERHERQLPAPLSL